jgi:tetratricopeptide (TPR) repeat protein
MEAAPSRGVKRKHDEGFSRDSDGRRADAPKYPCLVRFPTLRLAAPAVLAAAALLVSSALARGRGPEEARDLLRRGRAPEAEALLAAAAAAAPGDREIRLALGEVRRLRCRLGEAEDAFRRALAERPRDALARAGLAEVHLLAGRPEDALREAVAAVDEGDGSSGGRAHRAKALALLELGRTDLALAAARRAAALSPDDARCLEALGAAEFRAGDLARSRAAYEGAVALDPRAEDANLRLGQGFAGDGDDRSWRDGDEAAAFAEAARAWEEGRLEEAEARFVALAVLRPDAYKYRLGVGLLRTALRWRGEERFGGDPTERWLARPAAPVEGDEDLGRIVRGLGSLGPVERHVVALSLGPARARFRRLADAGVSVHVLSLAEDLTDAHERRELRGRRTFDGRRYDHLRGVGGAQGAVGVEVLRQAAAFGFNMLAHEFAHQLHEKGFDEEERARVDALYAAAVAEGRALDYYAASNADEYFAQGYEAFVSLEKRGCLTETGRHTREELERRDPALAAFLRGVLDLSHETRETPAPAPGPAPR